MTHSWCRDVQRDEAVRAAEDGRSGPLPTLEQCISRAGQFTPSEAPKGAKCPERDNGLRTERVTLDVTHCGDSDASTWLWHKAMAEFCPTKAWEIESVRVVDETHFDDLAQVAMERAQRERDDAISEYQSVADQRDAAIRERDEAKADAEKSAVRIKSQAENVAYFRAERDEARAQRNAAIDERESLREQLESVACRAATAETALESAPAASGAANSPGFPKSSEPVAWAVMLLSESPQVVVGHPSPWAHMALYFMKGAAYAWRSKHGGTVVPLYTAPPPARGWLTEEEREAVEAARATFSLGCAGMPEDGGWYKLHKRRQDSMLALLARSTPPEVVLEDFTPNAVRNLDTKYLAGWDQCMALAKRAISAAGVTWKEANRE